jgi:hypothetical protein
MKKKKNNLEHLSIGEPTYRPSDSNKLAVVVNFCVIKRIPQDISVAKSCFDLFSDHSPALITLTAHALNQEKQPSSITTYQHTNWDDFRRLINERLILKVSFQIEEDIEAAVKFFNDTIQWAC